MLIYEEYIFTLQISLVVTMTLCFNSSLFILSDKEHRDAADSNASSYYIILSHVKRGNQTI